MWRFPLGRLALAAPLAIFVSFGASVSGEAQAAVTFQAAGTGVGGQSAISPAWPAHQAGDIALLFVEAAGGDAIALSAPNGFVEVTNSPQATGTSPAGTRLAVFWARATSSAMAAPTVADPGDHAYGVILTYRGAIASGDPWDVTGGGVKTPGSTTVIASGVTTTVADTLVVVGVTKDLDGPAAFVSSWVNGTLSNVTERADAGTNQGGGGGIAVMDGGMAAAGATGNTTITVTSSINAFLTIALKPPPSAVPTLTSPTATSILDTTATLGANITSDGGAAITARGTCWGTSPAPVTNCAAEGGTATGVFTQARTGLTAGTRLYYRGYATNSAGTGYSPDGSFYTEPTTQASAVNFTAVGSTTMTVNWTRGSGSGVIVLMKQGSAVDADPVDGTYTGYTANAAFGSGTQIGTGNYVVYKGTGTNVPVTGLTAATTYYVAVYEYAGTVDTSGVNQGTNYKLTPATGSQATSGSAIPTLTAPTATSIASTTATLGATITSDGGTALTARGTCWGTSPAPVTNCVAEGGTATGAFTQARTGLTAGTLLYYRGYATNSAGTGYSPDGSFYTEPTTQASAVNFTAVGSTTMTVNWTRGSGSGVIVLMKQGSAVNADPVDGTYTGYTASAAFGSGTQIGTGNYVVYKGTGTNVPVTGLTAATTYYVAVYEYAGTVDTSGVNQGTNYKLTPATGNQATTAILQVVPGLPSATVSACNSIDVSAPFTGDTDGDSSTTFRRGPSGTGPWTDACVGVTGSSPRPCTDGGVSGSSTYYYQVDFTDPDGVSGTDPQVIGPFTTPACAQNDTTAGTASLVVSGCREFTVSAPFTGDADGDGAVKVEYNLGATWPGTISCAATGGASPRMCEVTGLAPGTANYYVRVTYSDPDGVSGSAVQQLGPYATPVCGADQDPPVITFLAPARNGVISGGDVLKLQVYDKVGLAASSPVKWSLDGGAFGATGVSANANYTCGTGCTVYEITVTPSAGAHGVVVSATDAAGNVAWSGWAFRGTAAGKGSGEILRRTRGSQICADCHNLQTHNAQNTSAKYGNWALDCMTCHTPHDTPNIYLIRGQIETPRSGTKSPVFWKDDRAGDTNPANSYLGASTSVYDDGVCEVCHTRTNHYRNDTSGGDHTHNQSRRCVTCHQHAKGFGGGESGGNTACATCHAFGMTVAEAARTAKYHHVMEVDADVVSGLTVYPTAATPTAATADKDKACVQCHADHNVFNPAINLGNSIGRGANLRTRIANTPPTAASGSTLNAAPGDVAGSYYSNKDADATFANGGVCLSCHLNAQTKNVADQKTYTGDPAATVAIVPAAADFSASAHGFTVPGRITNGASAFTVACAKCHGGSATSYQDGTWTFDTHTSTNRRLLQTLGIASPGDPLEENFCFRCHSRTTDTTPGGGPAKTTANRDYFNQAAMTGQSELVFSQFANVASYPWDHPVQGTGGLHNPVEGTTADDGTLSGAQRHIQCEDCHNPHAAAPIASGAYAGTVSAYTTAAAPNPDTLSDTGTGKAWTVNALKGFTVKITSGTQAGAYSPIYANTANTLSVDFAIAIPVNSTYIIANWGVTSTNATWTGNRVSPAMRDVWGVAPTWPTQPSPPNWDDSAGTPTAAEITAQYAAITTWGRTDAATVQGQICIKCHSAYAYGASPPNTPSGAPNSTATGWINTAGAATVQSDIANQFNPNNLAHHAVFARGRNQPIRSGLASYYNSNWPKFISGTGITVSTSGTTVTLAGSTWPVTLVPGWFINIGSAAPAQGATTWYEVTGVTSTTVLTVDRSAGTLTGQTFMLTAGLGNNFVPPWGPWSTLSCSDCHTSSVKSDPFGPHGSAIKWLLRGGESQSFLFYSGTGSTPTNVVSVAYTPDSYNMCLNCHRRDVYGDFNYVAPTYPLYPRQEHPIDAGKDHSLQYRSNWGIPCMNCHGGARIGQIHGSNLGLGDNGAGGTSYSGRRLLAGSSWYSVTRSGTATAGYCWTKGSTDTVDNCGHTHTGIVFESGTSGRANYDYESGAN